MSLLSGLKFVGKKKEDAAPSATRSSDEGAAAPKKGGIAPRASMDWMTGPIDLLGRKKEESPPPLDAETLAKNAAEEENQKKIQDEIDQGVRDKSGLLYGLNVMSKAEDGGLTSSRCETFIGDNGASWRARALKRAKQEAERTNKPLEEVVRERWGSLEELKKGLGGGGGGRGGRDSDDRRKSWKKQDFRDREDTDRRKREDEGWRRVFSASSDERRPRLSVGREQTDKELISRFSQKLNEALGKVDVDEEGDRRRDGRKRERSRDRERDWKGKDDDDNDRRHHKRRERSRERDRRREDDRDDRDEEERRRRRKRRSEERPPIERETPRERDDEGAAVKEGSKKEDSGITETKGGKDRDERAPINPPSAPPAPAKAPADDDDDGPVAMEEDEDDDERLMAERRAKRQAALANFQARAPPAVAPPPPPPKRAEAPPPSTGAAAAAPPDPNKLAAQALKAKLKGDKATYERLMKEADEARQQVEANKAEAAKKAEERAQVEVVVPLDRYGRPVELAKGEELKREDMRKGARQGKLKTNEKWGQNVDLEELVRREKMGGDDMDKEFARNIVRLGSRYKGTEMKTGDGAGMDEEDYIDTRMFEKSEDRLTDRQKKKKQEQSAIRELGKWQEATQKCHLCMDSEHFRKHLMISLGEHVCLLLRTGASALVPGHCAIVPIKHTESLTACDEEVFAEVDKFKESLRRYYASTGKAVIFLDTAVSMGRKRHTAIEAIPVPRNAALDAPLYFKQGLMEVDEQWSTHKKLIDTKGRSIRQVVPKNFPYFHVDWVGGGYAHVVEDKDQFPVDFGMGVVAGMLGLDPPRFDRRNQRQDVGQEMAAVKSFIKPWAAFDWTTELDGGAYLEGGK